MSARGFLPTKRKSRNPSLPASRRSTVARALGVATVVALTLFVNTVAFATNRPNLQRTYPRAGGSERSAYTPQLHAFFDRDLALPPSWFKVSDALGPIAGVTTLSPPVSDTGGYRTISFRPNATLAEGAYTAQVRACPIAGDCTTVSFSFRIDDTEPAPPTITSPLDNQVRDDQPVIVHGTAEGGATVSLRENDELIGEGIADASGTFAIALPYPPEDGVLHTVQAHATDQAGNVSGPSSVTFRHDSVLRVPFITHPRPQEAFNYTSIQIRGTAKAGTIVEVFEGSTSLGTTPVAADTTWSLTASFSAGTHIITATSHDTYGSDGPSEARTFVVDLTAPGAPTIDEPLAGAVLPSSSVLVRGIAEPRSTVRIRESGVLRASALADLSGEWAVIMTFSEGPHTIAAEARDRAGNVGPQAFRSFSVDTVAPPPPTITAPADGAFVNTSTVTVTGVAESGSTVRILEGQSLLGTAVSTGSWAVGIPLADGAHTIHAVAVDAGGNASPPSTPVSFSVDTVVPAPPTIATPAQSSTVTSNPVVFTGMAEGGATVTVFEGATPVGSGVADGTSMWRVEAVMTNGVHNVHAVAIDAATNTSAASAIRSFTVNVAVDTTPPAAPTITDPVTGSLHPGVVSVKGTAEPGATVTVYESGTPLQTATATGTGTWATGISFATGSHTIYATATDAAGNVSPLSATVTFDVDATRPKVTFDQVSNLVHVGLAPLVYSGKGTDNVAVVRVELEFDDLVTGVRIASIVADTCTGCPGAAIDWSSSPASTVVPPGAYIVRAYAVDSVGNRSTAVSIVGVVARL